ncbi:zinc finger, CCHC-type containing protein [Tanacetum coccineum]
MGEPLSPDRVFDFPMDEPHPTYDYFAPAPLPGYAGNLSNKNGWLVADDYLLRELEAMMDEQMVVPTVDEIVEQIDVHAVEEVAEPVVKAEEEQVIAPVADVVEGQMDAPMMDMEEDLAVMFGDDDFEDDASDGFGEDEVALGLHVPPCMIKDLSTRLDNLEYGHGQLVQRVIQGSDVEITASVIIGEIGPRVLVVEGQMQVMASHMIQVVDKVERVLCLGSCKTLSSRWEQCGTSAIRQHPVGENECSFHRIHSEDPNQHLKDFLKLVESLDLDVANRERTRMRLFQFSLRDQARNWLERLPTGSISTWEDLTTRFLAQFFLPGRTSELRNDILMFQQHQDEYFSKAWTHFKDLLQKFSHHGIDLWLQIQISYDHVSFHLKSEINHAASSKLRDKNAEES